MKRTPLRRTSKLRRVGARFERDEGAIGAFRRALAARSPDRCERCGRNQKQLWASPLHSGRNWFEAHHIVGRGRAQGWLGLHDPEINGLRVCCMCHDRLTLDPHSGILAQAKIDRAYRLFEAWRAGR